MSKAVEITHPVTGIKYALKAPCGTYEHLQAINGFRMGSFFEDSQIAVNRVDPEIALRIGFENVIHLMVRKGSFAERHFHYALIGPGDLIAGIYSKRVNRYGLHNVPVPFITDLLKDLNCAEELRSIDQANHFLKELQLLVKSA